MESDPPVMNSRVLAVALTATSLALTASPAMAKGGGGSGGGGGGGTTAPAPTPQPADPPPSLCPEYMGDFVFFPDGSTALANEIPGVGCVVSKATLSNALILVEVRVAPGWAYEVKSSGGGSQNRVDVEFTNGDEKHSIMTEPGKTVIR
jgi:hypothetical protein